MTFLIILFAILLAVLLGTIFESLYLNKIRRWLSEKKKEKADRVHK